MTAGEANVEPGRPIRAADLVRLAAGGLALTAAVFLVSTRLGAVHLAAGAWWGDPVWRLRAVRSAAAAVAGGALGLAGAAIQGLLRNPLGEPYVLGLSSGAGVGVRLGSVLGAGVGWMVWSTPALAFAGAGVSAALVYWIAWRGGRRDPWSLVLAGVMMNVVNGAAIMALYLFGDPLRLDEFARWAMGEVPDAAAPGLVALCAAITAAAGAVLYRGAGALNAVSLGEEVAHSVGVPVAALRLSVFLAAGAATAAAVALAGPVSFIGLLVPHVGRRAVGPDHRRLLPWSLFGGAILLMLADALCRFVGASLGVGRVPAGLVTALIGGPAFLAILRREAAAGGRFA